MVDASPRLPIAAAVAAGTFLGTTPAEGLAATMVREFVQREERVAEELGAQLTASVKP